MRKMDKGEGRRLEELADLAAYWIRTGAAPFAPFFVYVQTNGCIVIVHHDV